MHRSAPRQAVVLNGDMSLNTHDPWRILGALITGCSCLYISYAMLGAWLDPLAWDEGKWVRFGVGLLLLEFLILHSSAMLTAISSDKPISERLKYYFGLIAFYLLLGYGFAAATESPALLLILATVMLGRLCSSLTGGARPGFPRRAAFGVVAYLGCAAISVFVAFPDMGLSDTLLAEVYPSRGGGLWEREPQQALVAGAIYFAVTGLMEILVFSRDDGEGLPLEQG